MPVPIFKGPQFRLGQVRQVYDHLPAWRCQTFTGACFYVCGRCFGLLGDGPASNAAEIWKPGTDGEGRFHYDVVPADARCLRCGGRAWPAD